MLTCVTHLEVGGQQVRTEPEPNGLVVGTEPWRPEPGPRDLSLDWGAWVGTEGLGHAAPCCGVPTDQTQRVVCGHILLFIYFGLMVCEDGVDASMIDIANELQDIVRDIVRAKMKGKNR